MAVFAYIDSSAVIQTLALCDSSAIAAQQVAALGYSRAEDCTGYDPIPYIGWTWPLGGDPEYGDPPAAPESRIIANLELAQRFTDSEFEALANHAATAAKAFVTRLQLCGNVWLDDPRLAIALDKMVTAGILTADRPAEIMA